MSAIGLDANMLVAWLDDRALPSLAHGSGLTVEDLRQRLALHMAEIGKTPGGRIIVPTPALAEFLVKVSLEDAPGLLQALRKVRGVEIVPFGEKAAIEFAEMQRKLATRKVRAVKEPPNKGKAKFDQQIAAIAVSEGVETFYTHDKGLAAYLENFSIETVALDQLPTPPRDPQANLFENAPTPPPSVQKH